MFRSMFVMMPLAVGLMATFATMDAAIGRALAGSVLIDTIGQMDQ